MTLLVPALFLTAFICGSVSGEDEELRKVALASNDFSFKLFEEFGSRENVFFSPASIFIALSMLYQGAGGETAQEMRQVLSYDAVGLSRENLNKNIKELLSSIAHSSGQYVLDISNAMLAQVQYPVADEYKEVLKTYYDAMLKEVDFANDGASALEEINNWVSTKTRGKIEMLLESLDPNAALVLLNAAYFKSPWEFEFTPEFTINATFYNKGIDPVVVPMMLHYNPVPYWENENIKALKLPYRGNNVSMVLLLPKERNGLNKLEQELNATVLENIISEMHTTFVPIEIPRVTLECSKDLKPVLQSLGMNKMFANEADLSSISATPSSETLKLKVSKVNHKAYVEVNEGDSEVDEEHGTRVRFISSNLPLPLFYAHHPFLCFIRDERRGMILFSGRVNEL